MSKTPQIDLKEIGREIFSASQNPKKLDAINIKLSGWYAFYSEVLIDLEYKEALFHQNTKSTGEKVLSDKTVESLWKITEDGKMHVRVAQTMKTVEKLMSNIKSSIRRSEVEAKNYQ